MKSQSKIIDSYIFDLMDALRSPVLTHAIAWADTIPERLLKVIPIARLKNLMLRKETATDPEALAFIYTRTLEAPMAKEWVDIYAHLTCKVAEEYWKENHWEVFTTSREISKYDMNYFLKPLKKHIYDRRRKILKERMKTSLKKPVTQEEKADPVTPVIVDAQLLLF